jgi:hypothetical protein
MSRTVPIFKSGDPESCDNYRPISLLSSISQNFRKSNSYKVGEPPQTKQTALRKPVWVPGRILHRAPSFKTY